MYFLYARRVRKFVHIFMRLLKIREYHFMGNEEATVKMARRYVK